MEWDESIQRAIEEALQLQASGSWRSLQQLSCQYTGSDQAVAHALLLALCANPLQQPEEGRTRLMSLAEVAPRSACAIALSRSLLSLAQDQLLTDQRASAETTLRQALACAVNAVVVTGIPVPSHLSEQLLSQAGQTAETIACQMELALARQHEQLPSQLVLVLGMHRSGTSALSGLLVQSGLDGPQDLMPATKANPRGYYESVAMMQINEQLLGDLGCQWSTSKPIPVDCWESHAETLESWRFKILKLLQTKYPAGGRAVIKDPRLCILLPALRPWLESTLIPCTAFLQVRHPAEVADSLWLSEQIPRSQGLMIWLCHVIQAERYSRGLDRLIVDYREILDDEDDVLDHCYQTLELSKEANGLKQVPSYSQNASTFIDPELHRQRAQLGVPEWCFEEAAGTPYSLALRVYAAITDIQSSELERQFKMNHLWSEWTAFYA